MEETNYDMTAISNYNEKGFTVYRWYILAISETEIHKRSISWRVTQGLIEKE